MAFANAIHNNKGQDETQIFFDNVVKNKKILSKNLLAINSYIKSNTKERFVFPGGIYGNSGLLENLLKMNNVDYFTFDSGFSTLLSSYKGVAAHLADIPMALDLILQENNENRQLAIDFANQEFEKRKNGTNKFNNQYQSFNESLSFDNVGILIPLNSP